MTNQGLAYLRWFDAFDPSWEACCDRKGRVLWVIPPGFDRTAFFTPMMRTEVVSGSPVFIAYGVTREVAMNGAGLMWSEWSKAQP